MSKLSPYLNEIISLVVMLLLLAALISGQINNRAMNMAGVDDGSAEVSHVRLDDE